MSNNFKKSVDLEHSSIGKRDLVNTNSWSRDGIGRGFGNTKLFEPLPKFIKAESEKVIQGENNQFIILGRDRPHSRLSGYGGRGDTQSGSIDIVVGRLGREIKEVDDTGQEVFTDPNFELDSARIYISQKTDIDSNFNLVNGSIGNLQARSGIAIKADNVRMISREGIKLVTGVEKKNSSGGDITSIYGIDLISGNDDSDLQPIPKGKNLVDALDRLLEHVKSLTSIVETHISNQIKFNQAVVSHTHIGNLSAPVTPSIELVSIGVPMIANMLVSEISNIPLHRTNMEMFKMNYLKPIGSKYINSRHNNTT